MGYRTLGKWGWRITCMSGHNWTKCGPGEELCVKCRCTKVTDEWSIIIYDVDGKAVHHRKRAIRG